jgi:hypothetical protein
MRAGPAYDGTSPTDVRIRCQVGEILWSGKFPRQGSIGTFYMTPSSHSCLYTTDQNHDGSRSKRCDEPAFYQEVMGEQYPRVEVYDCDVK